VTAPATTPSARLRVRFPASRDGVELPASVVFFAGASPATVHGSVKQQAAAGPVTGQAASANTVFTAVSLRAPR
jgi:hypothetical protein